MLTPRQVQVLQLVAEGLTDQQIARQLRIRPRTARFNVASVLFKLGAGNREADVERILEITPPVVERLRALAGGTVQERSA